MLDCTCVDHHRLAKTLASGSFIRPHLCLTSSPSLCLRIFRVFGLENQYILDEVMHLEFIPQI